MSEQGGRAREGGGRGWLVFAGAGVAAALYAAWAAARSRRPPGAVGAHAWLVPTPQARVEGKWTRQAMGHASEFKHG